MSKTAELEKQDDPIHIFQSNSIGLPHLPTYFRELWRRRDFAYEMSRSTLRIQQANTVIGKFWLVLNPLLLAGVYYFLVMVISSGSHRGPEYFAHLVAGIFAFYFISNSMIGGAASITGAARLVMNASFPRLLLPIAAVRTAFGRFIPTVPIFMIFYVIGGSTLKWQQLLAIPVFGLMMVFSIGMAAFFAALQVYFRDTTAFLPYLNRILLYISPVLYYPDQARHYFKLIGVFNPLFPLLGAFSDTLVRGIVPSVGVWLACVAWAISAFLFGCWFFMSREREFAVRL
ncbi:MAG: ABC transporter permease [Actinomycetes bacterium]